MPMTVKLAICVPWHDSIFRIWWVVKPSDLRESLWGRCAKEVDGCERAITARESWTILGGPEDDEPSCNPQQSV